MNHLVLGRFSCLGLSWQLCNNGKKSLNFKKNMLTKLGHHSFPCLPEMQFCHIFLLQNTHPKIYLQFKCASAFSMSTFSFSFKLHETGRGGNYPCFTWDKLFSFPPLMVFLGTHLKAQKELINEMPHIDKYHIMAPEVGL